MSCVGVMCGNQVSDVGNASARVEAGCRVQNYGLSAWKTKVKGHGDLSDSVSLT